ncbi:MAG: EAL domain-containing protein, partial [Clostridia bacterium]|nr:EAL domain-containing protein [Clostridia bacterium]
SLKNKLASQHFVFLLMLATNMLSSISSVVGVYLTTASFSGVVFWQYLFHALYFIFHATLSISFTLYIMNVTGTSLNWKKPAYILFALPYLISEVLILTNSFTSWTFYMDENLVYHRGPLMPLLYGFGAFYVAIGFVFFFKNKKAISRLDSIAVGTFIVLATLGIVVQAIYSKFLVELFSESLACLVIMIVLEEKSGHVDATTGLLTSVAFIDANRRMMSSRQKYGIVFLKLPDFEKFVKKIGVREANAFLMNVAAYLVKESGVPDVYCYGRGAFAVVFKDEKYGEATSFAEKALERFSGEWIVDSLKIRADAVATLIRVPEDIKTLDELENAISSDYQKTKAGSYFVSVEEIRKLTKFGTYEEALRKAVAEKKLTLKYQPIWSVKDRRTVSAEALLRVDSDELRNVSPEVYIPIAEKTGLIKDIGLFVFEEVCRFLKNERIKNTALQYVELNLSVYQFMYSDLVEKFEEIRKKYGVDARLINLEITETAAEENGDILKTLEKFGELGYTLSLDDFGTGYSNLVRMVGTSYRNVKIDKSILWNVAKDGSDPDLLKNMMAFIDSFGFDIIQEGVETKDQLDLVIGCGCDYIQGFYFLKPVTENEFFDYLENEPPLNLS